MIAIYNHFMPQYLQSSGITSMRNTGSLNNNSSTIKKRKKQIRTAIARRKCLALLRPPFSPQQERKPKGSCHYYIQATIARANRAAAPTTAPAAMLPLSVFAALVFPGAVVEVLVGMDVILPVIVMRPEVNGTSLTRVAEGKAADWLSSAVFGVSLVLFGFKTLRVSASV